MGWADVKILRNAGLEVKTDVMDTLFRMIDKNEIIDYFPLGANEIFNLVTEKNKEFPNLMVEKELMIVYPFDFFFFVHRENKPLHDMVYNGLLKAYADGSFEELFTSHPDHRAFLNSAKLKTRHKIAIDNPFLSEKTKGLLKEYADTP